MRRDTLLLALLCLAQFMLILDVAIVAVALPPIQADLDLAPADMQWVTTAYALTFGGFMVVAGRAADLYGARAAFLAGIALFVAASAACATAQSGTTLLIARGVQGLGAAIVSPAALALLTGAFAEGVARNRAFAAWGAVASIGATAGQLVGGVITDALDWRWIFLVNVPVGVGLVLAGRRLLPTLPRVQARLDLPGATLLTAGLVALVYATAQAGKDGLDGPVLALAAGGGLLLGAFAVVERRVAAPMLRFELFASRHVRRANAVMFLNAGAVGAVVFLTTIYLQRTLELSPLQTGLAFAPVTAAIALISTRTAALVGRYGVRAVVSAGMTIVLAGAIVLTFVSPDGSYVADVLPGLALVGIGSGLSFAPAMSAATTGIGDDERGAATGVASTSPQLGQAILLALLTAIAFGANGTTAASLADVDALADGLRATAIVAAVALLVALRVPGRERAIEPRPTI